MLLNQATFFEEVKSKTKDNHSLVYDLTELLEISTDSTYRRIRGETPLTFDEIVKVCKRYNISFDSLCQIKNENVVFQYKSLVDASCDIFSCFKKIYTDFSLIQQSKDPLIISAASDIPSFQLFKYPELTGFRLHNWIFNMLKNEESDVIDYNSFIQSKEYKLTLDKIVKVYNTVPSIEIWTSDTISGLLQAIEFYYDSYLFEDKQELINLCDCVLDMLNGLFNKPHEDNLKLYISDIAIENNYTWIRADDLKFVYLKLYSLNNIMTTNASFCSETEVWLNNLMQKSTLVSGASEKKRKKFYHSNSKRVNALKTRIEQEL